VASWRAGGGRGVALQSPSSPPPPGPQPSSDQPPGGPPTMGHPGAPVGSHELAKVQQQPGGMQGPPHPAMPLQMRAGGMGPMGPMGPHMMNPAHYQAMMMHRAQFVRVLFTHISLSLFTKCHFWVIFVSISSLCQFVALSVFNPIFVTYFVTNL